MNTKLWLAAFCLVVLGCGNDIPVDSPTEAGDATTSSDTAVSTTDVDVANHVDVAIDSAADTSATDTATFDINKPECLHDNECDDGNVCTSDTCAESVNKCIHTPIVCDDSNACTLNTCDLSTGCSTTDIDCDDNDPLTTDSCDKVLGCQNVKYWGVRVKLKINPEANIISQVGVSYPTIENGKVGSNSIAMSNQFVPATNDEVQTVAAAAPMDPVSNVCNAYTSGFLVTFRGSYYKVDPKMNPFDMVEVSDQIEAAVVYFNKAEEVVFPLKLVPIPQEIIDSWPWMLPKNPMYAPDLEGYCQ